MKLFTLIIFICLIVNSGSTRIWTVDNTPGNTAADFAEIQDAIYAAQSGDSIYVQGSTLKYLQFSLDKKLFIFGPGYFLSENDSTQANKNMASTNYISFSAGSEGSLMTGLDIDNIIYIYADSITIMRNHIWLSFESHSVQLYAVNHCAIMQNYIGSSNSFGQGISLSNNSNYNIIKNNCIVLEQHASSNSIQITSNCLNNIVQNNVLNGNLDIYNSEITNNILVFGSYSGTGNILMNNMCNSTQFAGVGEYNLTEIDMGTVFTGSGSTDGQWQIIADGPADGSGTNGTDMGIFGGNDPYVLSGIPPIPAIYEFYGTNAGATTFPVQVKIKARK